MKKYHKRNKFVRYLRVFKRGFKKLNRRKAWRWFKKNLKSHPFILILLLIAWINAVFMKVAFNKWDIKLLLITHFLIFISWPILVVLSNSLGDKPKVKWYFKKRFVFFMLLLWQPLGLVFLWLGSKFKKITKIILTLIFGSVFVISSINYNKKYEKLLNMSQLEKTIEIITSQKKKIFLKTFDKDVLGSLKLANIPPRNRVKLAVSDIAKRCSPAVVSIKTKDKNGEEIGAGSGFVISQEGLLVTNFHVMESAYQAEVKLGEEVFREVYLVKAEPRSDIVILKIDAKNLPFLPIGNPDSLLAGQFVVAIGNPWGFERSVSSGIISAIRSRGDIKLIQMTTPVSPGSSGGPVLNEYGEVIGITTLASFFIAQNLNFAIPINYLNKVIKK